MAEVVLKNGMIALVDDADLPLVSGMTWAAIKIKNVWYARHCRTFMHRVIFGAKKGEMLDHENGNGLDNRRVNLRYTNHQANKANQHHGLDNKTSKYVGVSKRGSKFRVSMKINGRNVSCGSFPDEMQAAMHYDAMAIKIHGSGAFTNL